MFSFILVIVYLSFVYVCCSGKEERHMPIARVIINQIIMCCVGGGGYVVGGTLVSGTIQQCTINTVLYTTQTL